MIASTIENILKNKGAVLVFFENENILKDFEESSYVESFKQKLNSVSEKSFDRDFYIKKATS